MKILHSSSLIILLLIAGFNFSVLSQTDTFALNQDVILVNSESMDCDNSYDPYLLISRITNIEYENELTNITINFTDNCCASFDPSIEFRNDSLILSPYAEFGDIYCTCDCCFSIKYTIAGLKDKKYVTLFKGKEIVRSDYHYKIVEPTYEVYNGEKINQTNIYGFKEGLWIEFYKDGPIKDLSKYHDHSYRFRPHRPIWSKGFYPSGAPSRYEREDTSQMWFEDGTLDFESIDYKIDDTSFEYVYSVHDDRTLQHKSLSKYYPTLLTSVYDTCYSIEIRVHRIMYNEAYYENGQRKELYSNDTTYRWYENGQLEQVRSSMGSINYTNDGQPKSKAFYWKKPGLECEGDLDHSLYIDYYPNGNIKEIRYKRDEINRDQYYREKSYEWKWDDQMHLKKSPENWSEPFPWRKIRDLKIPRKMLK